MKKFTGKQIVAIALSCVVGLTGIAGVVGSKDGDFASPANGAETYLYEAPETYGMTEESDVDMSVQASGNVLEKSATPTNDYYKRRVDEDPIIENKERAIVKTARLSVTVKSYKDFLKELNGKIEAYGGYTANSQEYNYDGIGGNITIKIPADKLDKFLDFIDANAHVSDKSVGVSDITNDYVDTNAKIKNYLAEEATLVGLLDKAENLSDILAIEDKLAEIRSQIDYYQSMMNRMKESVSMSTVTINISETQREIENGSGFFYEIKEGFINSLYAIGNGFREMAIWFISSIPFFAILLVFVILFVKIVRVVRNRKSKKAVVQNDRSEQDGGQTDN